MPNVRSAVLLAAASADGELAGYTFVPPGYTWIVKSVLVLNQSGATQVIKVFVTHATGQPTADLINATFTALQTSEWDGWVALAPGDVLRWSAEQAFAYIWISGTKLLGVAPPSDTFPRVRPLPSEMG